MRLKLGGQTTQLLTLRIGGTAIRIHSCHRAPTNFGSSGFAEQTSVVKTRMIEGETLDSLRFRLQESSSPHNHF